MPAATSHMVTAKDLKKAHKVIRMQRKQRMQGTQKESEDDVFDVDVD